MTVEAVNIARATGGGNRSAKVVGMRQVSKSANARARYKPITLGNESGVNVEHVTRVTLQPVPIDGTTAKVDSTYANGARLVDVVRSSMHHLKSIRDAV